MPFWKLIFNRSKKVYHPQAVVMGDPVETETIAKDLARISTVSVSDVMAVLGDIAPVMHHYLSRGKSIHIKGLGYFRYSLATTGVADLSEVDFQRQVKAVRVEFAPERQRAAEGGGYTRELVNYQKLDWVEVPTKYTEQRKTLKQNKQP